MAANFTIHFGTAIDTQGLMTGVNNIMQTISKAPPVTVNAQVKPVDTGDARKVLENITAQGKALQDVTVRQVTYRNAVGETYTAIVQMTTKYKTETGQMVTQTDRIANGIKGLGAGWTEVKNILVKAPIGKQIAEFETYYKKQEQAFDKMAAKGAEWSTRAEKMGQKEKQAIQESVNLLNQKINLYKQAVSSGNIQEAERFANAVRTQNGVVEENIAKSKRAANAVRSWADNIKNAIVQTASYAVSLGSLRAAQQLLNEAISFAIELNKEMTKIQLLQVEGAQTDEEINSLAQSYNGLAKELGATTLEVAKGSVEWLRQGKTIEETTELLKASTMLSKLGNMDAAESTEYLTSAVNGYGMAASQAASIVDKLIAVDNVAATSAKELATALRYSSAVASQAGVPLEKLISYIGVISSTTRQNAEMIGQALKTIFTRMQDIKQGGLDEDGLGINNVERALRRVDIQLRDSQTEFRSMSDVLEDLAAKWDTLNEVEQANIGKAMAGVRQQNMFMILMTNMNKALELQEVQYNANGLAVDRYGIYLKSVEASQNKLKASAESLFMSFKDLDNIIMFVNNLAGSFLDLITDMGGLKTVLTLVTTALIFYSTRTLTAATITQFFTGTAMKAAIMDIGRFIVSLFSAGTATATLTAGIKGLYLAISTAFATNPIGWIAILIGGMIALGNAIDSPIERLDKLNKKTEELRDNISGLGNKANDIKKLSVEYDNLKTKASTLTITADETERLTKVQNELVKLMPDLIGHYDNYGNFIVDATQDMRELNAATIEQIELGKKAVQDQLNDTAGKRAKDLALLSYASDEKRHGGIGVLKSGEDKLKEVQALQTALAKEKGNFAQMGKEAQNEFIRGFSFIAGGAKLKEIFIEFQKQLYDAKQAETFGARWSAGVQDYFEANPIKAAKFEITEAGILGFVQGLQDKLKKFNDIKSDMATGDVTGINAEDLNMLGLELENVAGKWQFTAESLKTFNEELDIDIDALREVNPALADQIVLLKNQKAAQEDVTASLSDLISAQEMLSNAMKEQNDNGSISIDTAMRLIDAGYASALTFNQQTGAITLNIEAMRQANIAKANLAVTTAYLAWQDQVAISKTGALTAALYAEYQAAKLAAGAIAALAGMPIATAPPQSSGGGGGGGESAEKKAIEEKIKALEDEKDALKDRLDAFNDYIKAQKESLKLAKEEADFNKEQAKKNQELADIKTEIALLALDDSQEARNRRLELEGEAADLETEIAEDSEDRKLDLQLQALDDVQEAFEDVINAQMDAIDESIDAYREQAQAINSSGGATVGYGNTVASVYQQILAKLASENTLTNIQKNRIQEKITKMQQEGATADELIAKYEYMLELYRNLETNYPGAGEPPDEGDPETVTCFVAGTQVTMENGKTKNIEDVVIGEFVLSSDNGYKIGTKVVEVFEHTTDKVYMLNNSIGVTGEHLLYVNEEWIPVWDIVLGDRLLSESGSFVIVTSIEEWWSDFKVFNLHTNHSSHNYFANGVLVHNSKHTGGIVESHHGGEFAGGLKSNEVFSKLIKGEFVSTEAQMNNFLKNILPRIAGGQTTKSSIQADTNVKVEINIAGSVAKEDLPALKETVMGGVNKSLRDKGIKRLAGSFSV